MLYNIHVLQYWAWPIPLNLRPYASWLEIAIIAWTSFRWRHISQQSRILLTEDDTTSHDGKGCDTVEIQSIGGDLAGLWCSIDRSSRPVFPRTVGSCAFPCSLALCKRRYTYICFGGSEYRNRRASKFFTLFSIPHTPQVFFIFVSCSSRRYSASAKKVTITIIF